MTNITIVARYDQMPMENVFYDKDIYGAYIEVMDKFYNGSMTAEQVASELQNKVSLYLME